VRNLLRLEFDVAGAGVLSWALIMPPKIGNRRPGKSGVNPLEGVKLIAFHAPYRSIIVNHLPIDAFTLSGLKTGLLDAKEND
jgi:hypothetical protein